ncbi:hypothetical protein BLNAU_16696 [Blattamonas nauphoetae]|uniref:Uncharacterized protein n=1 Tax=Blattamonas nauphoetae TaxID=2049346 RepID=A0ABQ9XAJ3_9EUKA|nr:hypothetical protein BLNAU_16696 [Blattamonas nauphoetae]
MSASDFDFDGFLAAELTGTQLFDEACSFVITVLSSTNASMTAQWKSDLLLQFEKRHHVLDYLAGKRGPRSDKLASELPLTTTHIIIAQVLSLLHGYTFPSELTELLTIDLETSPHRFAGSISAAVFLCHNSIATKHRRSFFPMDLMFERHLRENPDAFFVGLPNLRLCSVRQFLYTPLVGLHSLLVRSIPLSFNEEGTLTVMLDMLIHHTSKQIPFHELYCLFSYFPPPRLLHLLTSSHRLLRASKVISIRFLNCFRNLCGSVAPFGACSSLADVFQLLFPFDSNPDENELNLLRDVGSVVVSLHWLSIPAHFDSPLLCHLPSLAGAQ